MNTQPELRLGYHLVIIVEDDRAVRDSLKFSLVVEGFAVRAYPDAEHLLAEEHLPDFDCLIVDQNMPGMNGLDLISRAKLKPQPFSSPAIPIHLCAIELLLPASLLLKSRC
jgi:two-component system, LuxR family, response regulator FixJ